MLHFQNGEKTWFYIIVQSFTGRTLSLMPTRAGGVVSPSREDSRRPGNRRGPSLKCGLKAVYSILSAGALTVSSSEDDIDSHFLVVELNRVHIDGDDEGPNVGIREHPLRIQNCKHLPLP